MSKSSDNGGPPGSPPGRLNPPPAAPGGRAPVAQSHSPYAEQEAFDGAYDSYGDPLTGPPARDPRLPDQRSVDQRVPERRGLGGHSAVGQYLSQYPVAPYNATTAASAQSAGQQPSDPNQGYNGDYQTDPRYAQEPRQSEQWPGQAHRADSYGRPSTEPKRQEPPAAPGSLRAMLPPSQPLLVHPTTGQNGPAQRAPASASSSGPQSVQQPNPVASHYPPEADLEPDTQRPTNSGSASSNREMYAPARTDKTDKNQGNAPIVPAGSVTGRSLTLVISIMCFLACLTAGAVYMMNQSASAWLKDIASEVTVQVEGRDKADSEKVLNDVAAFLNQQPGIVKARVLSLGESGGLLEPWIGNAEALKTLAVPRLIALELDRRTPPDFEPLRAKLASTFKGVFLDDHRQWQTQIRTVTRSFALGGLAILLLVAAATTAIIISATRAAMASNREIVEVLHFVGATDRFIAREFERNFLRLGVRAGLVGAVSAMIVFALMPTLMELLGGGTMSLAEMRRMVGSGTLDLVGYGVLAALVVVVAALCMLTSRFSVYRILHTRQ
jgi:cell division transport system permease protein